jgi:hypothetical protein
MKRILLGLLIALALPAFLLAQAKPAAAPSGQKLILEFVDGSDLTVTLGDKVLKYGAGVLDGDELAPGSSIKTGATTTAELRIKPNGTIIKIAKSTTFTVQNIASSNAEKNTFALVAGKVRTIAAKGGQYDMKSQTAVCGVRGTDFAFSVEPGAKEQLTVANGRVEMQKLDANGAGIGDILPVNAGEFADAMASVFAAAKFTADQFAAEFGDMKFQKLIETEVPGHAEEIGAAPAAAPASPVTPATGNVETKQVSAADAASTLAQGASKLTKSDVESGLVKWLRDVLGMELGSVTINNLTYSKAVIQPNFNFGKLKLGLYLPIIYTSNMFDPKDWYHPNGNDEWSFGTDIGWKDNTVNAALDAVSDLALKIKYFEVGTQLEDPFFIKVGNLDDLTLGHGLIMRNYVNNTEFPAVRRVGFNVGMDFKAVGLELLSNDLADLQNGIFGARFFFRPIPSAKFAIGFSGVVDTAPFAAVEKTTPGTAAAYGDPMIVGAGVDVDLPLVTSGLLALRLFADGAAETEWLRADATNSSAKAGLATSLIYDSSAATPTLSNWGAAGGLIGRLLMINFRLEYRYYTGIFKPSLFDSTYDKMRATYAIEYAGYIAGTSKTSDQPSVMGIYGEGGFSFLKDKLTFDMGYMWPWDKDIKLGSDFAAYLKQQVNATTDEFHAKLVVKKGLIPIFDVAGTIFYDRKGIARSIANATSAQPFMLFDSDTTFGGELSVPVPKTPNLDIAVVFAAVPEHNQDGTTKWVNNDATKGIPEMIPSISFETRLHF